MHAVVTGGAGFIGSTLVDRLLSEGHRVQAIDDLSTGSLANLDEARRSPYFGFAELDVRTNAFADLVRRERPEVIFHLAAQPSVAASLTDPLRDADVNVLGSVNLLDAARAANTRKVVFAASGGTLYGEVDPTHLPATEACAHQPESPYGISKMVVLSYLRAFRRLHGLDFTALALANVYGPRQDPHGEAGVVAIFSACLEEGERPRVFGDGEQTRDFVYVDDVAEAFVRAADRGGGLVINIGTGVETSVNELVRELAGAARTELAPEHVAARAGELRRSSLDPSLAGVELGWRPTTALRPGLAAVLTARSEHAPRAG